MQVRPLVRELASMPALGETWRSFLIVRTLLTLQWATLVALSPPALVTATLRRQECAAFAPAVSCWTRSTRYGLEVLWLLLHCFALWECLPGRFHGMQDVSRAGMAVRPPEVWSLQPPKACPRKGRMRRTTFLLAGTPAPPRSVVEMRMGVLDSSVLVERRAGASWNCCDLRQFVCMTGKHGLCLASSDNMNRARCRD